MAYNYQIAKVIQNNEFLDFNDLTISEHFRNAKVIDWFFYRLRFKDPCQELPHKFLSVMHSSERLIIILGRDLILGKTGL